MLTLAISLPLMAGCKTGQKAEGDQAKAETRDEADLKPAQGMTKAQIIDMYGPNPRTTQINSDGGETWVYHVNPGAAWIPFNYGYRAKFHSITFDGSGVVTSFSITE